MDRKRYLSLAEDIIEGDIPNRDTYREILMTPDDEISGMLCGADLIRGHFFKKGVHLCTICNGKSGKCSEDCGFCSQSAFSKTDAPVYPLMEKKDLKKGGLHASETPIHRYSIVTTGKGLPKKEVKSLAEAMAELDGSRIGKCASLGIIGPEEMMLLKDSGVNRYHHNLETSESFFQQVCTTHGYDERVNTLLEAKRAGFELCSGGIFGLGEGPEHILELGMAFKEINVDSVPVNFLTPIKGTPFEAYHYLTPLKCLKIIAFLRYLLPDKEIIICGGREYNLGELHPMIFYAGASGIMTGNYLTTEGRTLEKDLKMIDSLGFTVRDPL